MREGTDETARVLRDARELISDPTHWTQKTMARDEAGRDLVDHPLHEERAACLPQAVCFCAGGAIARALGEEGSTEMGRYRLFGLYSAVLSAADARDADEGWIGPWNDNPRRTHAEVLAAFDKAIELAEAKS